MPKKKKHPVRNAFLMSLFVSLSVFSVIFALNLNTLLGQGSPVPFWLNTSGSSEPVNPIASDSSSPAISFEEYLEQTIFMGDSRTNGMTKYGFTAQSNTYAIDGANHLTARTERFINHGKRKLTMAEAVGVRKPVRVMVSFGINGVAFMGEEKFMTEYANLIDDLKEQSPKSIIVIQSILPVSSSRAQSDPRMSNTVIDSYNVRLKALAAEKKVRYYDTTSVLKDSRNSLSSKYDSGDGLHFNESAYRALFEYYDQNRIN